ncbi:MAG: dioxygenase [Moraxellaceae bacterium]
MLPTLFISHGSPMLAVEPGIWGASWRAMADALPRPDAILVVSAHWTTRAPLVGSALQPATVHDFGGFPEALYQIRYPAPGAPALAARVQQLLAAAGIQAAASAQQGLDHGAWVPLMHMYPEAGVPVTPLSVQPGRDAAWHLALGRALRPLAGENVLVIGSGSLTHNLREFRFDAFDSAIGSPYVRAFQTWMHEVLSRHDDAMLVEWQSVAPEAGRAHPTPEHLLPLFVAYGAAAEGAQVRRPVANYSGEALAMDCYVFG